MQAGPQVGGRHGAVRRVLAQPPLGARHVRFDVFAEQLLQAEKVALVPGDAFGACGEGFVRCSYASSTKNLTEALDRIGRFVKPRLK